MYAQVTGLAGNSVAPLCLDGGEGVYVPRLRRLTLDSSSALGYDPLSGHYRNIGEYKLRRSEGVAEGSSGGGGREGNGGKESCGVATCTLDASAIACSTNTKNINNNSSRSSPRNKPTVESTPPTSNNAKPLAAANAIPVTATSAVAVVDSRSTPAAANNITAGKQPSASVRNSGGGKRRSDKTGQQQGSNVDSSDSNATSSRKASRR